MRTLLSSATLALLALTAPAAAAEQTATLADVAGVREVTVSLEEHRATVVYDDAAATIATLLTDATTQAGYPLRPIAP